MQTEERRAIGSLRAILRKHRLWGNIQLDVQMLKVRGDVDRALSEDERHRLLTACKKSRSLSHHTGLRNAELRLLRRRQVDLIGGAITVGKSKTVGGDGRIVPLSATALACMKEWGSQFPEAQPSHYVFPSERYGLKGEDGYRDGATVHYDTRPNVAIGSWKVARTAAGVECRWHDMRHTFVSTMAEGQTPNVTIMALAGHLSRKMMEHYSYTRNEAKRKAIAILDRTMTEGSQPSA